MQKGRPTSSPTTTKPLGIEDPLKHCPRKVDGDPWTVLLKPLKDADSIRCDAWKDEVQNLLIFAGLFSAVVTPFVVESYKFLKPDPNDAIINLLEVIASSGDTLNRTNLASSSDPFSPTPSSIRMNIFWFLSLILSLMTVLIGIIALQWLREHQSYPYFSSKETIAVLRMRSEAIERWYVPQMFAALPLLLQVALALFFAGLIDFALPLGVELTMTVSVIIGLTLVFLIATTIIPTFQGFVFYFPILRPSQKVPIPCPYKSPQSQAFRMLSRLSFETFSRIVPSILRLLRALRRRGGLDGSPTVEDSISMYICDTWSQRAWSQFDRKWLKLRDVCHQHILDKGPDLYRHRICWDNDFPLSDSTQCVVEAISSETQGSRRAEEYLTAAVHCFDELSEPIYRSHHRWWDNNCHRRDRRSRYLQELVTTSSKVFYHSVSNALVHGGHYEYETQFDDGSKKREHYVTRNSKLLHYDNTFMFLQVVLKRNQCASLYLYQLEIGSRMTQHMLKHGVVPFASRWLRREDFYSSITFVDFVFSSWDGMKVEKLGENVMQDFFVTFFMSVTCGNILQNDLIDCLHTHPKIPTVLGQLALLSAKHSLNLLQAYKTGTNVANQFHVTDNAYVSIFDLISSRLKNEVSQSTSAPIPLFYFAAIFMSRLTGYIPESDWLILDNEKNTRFISALRTLLDSLRRYRKWTGTVKNELIEERFRGTDQFTGMPRFSDDWWEFLDRHPKYNPPFNFLGADLPHSSWRRPSVQTSVSSYPVPMSSEIVGQSLTRAQPEPAHLRWSDSWPWFDASQSFAGDAVIKFPPFQEHASNTYIDAGRLPSASICRPYFRTHSVV